MRKITSLSILCICCSATAFSQAGFWRTLTSRLKPAPVSATSSRVNRMNISRQLEQRVARTYKQALQEQQANPQAWKTMPFGNPVQKVFHPEELDPRLLYPDQSFLQTSAQTANYLAARNNVLVRNELRRAQALQYELEQALPAFEQAAAQMPQPPTDISQIITQVASQISPTVQYIFVGEEHGYADIRQGVTTFVTALRAQYPQRPLFLFTEFLPAQESWPVGNSRHSVPDYLHVYFPIWQQVTQQQIPVIGLEPAYAVMDQCRVKLGNVSVFCSKKSVWETLEGVRLRNEAWQQLLDNYRTRFPQALFIIYTGADHCMYNRPFALPNHYAPGSSFVLTLHPASRTEYHSDGFLKIAHEVQVPARGPLERLAQQDKFPQPVLQWKDPDLARICGFDVRLKVPIEIPDI